MRAVTSTSPDDRLLDATRRAFAAHGYAGATLERIAAEAGLSRVTLHRRGISKEGLMARLVAEATDDYQRTLWPALTGPGSGAERLAASLGLLCEVAERHLALIVAARSQADRVFHEDTPEPLTRSVFADPLERLLRDGIADGSVRAVDPAETATVLFNLVGWTYVHLRTGHGWPPARAREATLGPALHGVVAGG